VFGVLVLSPHVPDSAPVILRKKILRNARSPRRFPRSGRRSPNALAPAAAVVFPKTEGHRATQLSESSDRLAPASTGSSTRSSVWKLRWPAAAAKTLDVQPMAATDHLQQAPRVVGVVDREVGVEALRSGTLVAQRCARSGVERGHPHRRARFPPGALTVRASLRRPCCELRPGPDRPRLPAPASGRHAPRQHRRLPNPRPPLTDGEPGATHRQGCCRLSPSSTDPFGGVLGFRVMFACTLIPSTSTAAPERLRWPVPSARDPPTCVRAPVAACRRGSLKKRMSHWGAATAGTPCRTGAPCTFRAVAVVSGTLVWFSQRAVNLGTLGTLAGRRFSRVPASGARGVAASRAPWSRPIRARLFCEAR